MIKTKENKYVVSIEPTSIKSPN